MSSSVKYIRAENLDVHETDDGLIVFDPSTDQVHHLNFSAGVLFELCAKARDATELAQMAANLYELDAPPTEEIETGLRQLLAEGVLIETGSGD